MRGVKFEALLDDKNAEAVAEMMDYVDIMADLDIGDLLRARYHYLEGDCGEWFGVIEVGGFTFAVFP